MQEARDGRFIGSDIQQIYSDNGVKEQVLGQNQVRPLKKACGMLPMQYFLVRMAGCLTERMPWAKLQ